MPNEITAAVLAQPEVTCLDHAPQFTSLLRSVAPAATTDVLLFQEPAEDKAHHHAMHGHVEA